MIDRWPQHADRPHCVYRLYAVDRSLLYIGCTLDFPKRLARHQRRQPWAGEIATWAVQWFDAQAPALAAEEAAIKAEAPRHNAMYNGAGLTGWNDERRSSTTCLHGHEWTPENTYLTRKGLRVCRECKREHGRRHDAKRRHSPVEGAA